MRLQYNVYSNCFGEQAITSLKKAKKKWHEPRMYRRRETTLTRVREGERKQQRIVQHWAMQRRVMKHTDTLVALHEKERK